MAKNFKPNKFQSTNIKLTSTELILPKVFRKPLQLYRTLKERHSTSPIFLHRTLDYMKNRLNRNKTIKRANFKVSKLLNESIKLLQSKSTEVCLKIDFLGYFINLSSITDTTLCVNVTLVKIIKSRSSSKQSYMEEVLVFSTDVAVNPANGSGDPVGSICIPLQVLRAIEKPNINYKLLINIEAKRQSNCEKASSLRFRRFSRTYTGEFSFAGKTSSIVAEGVYVIVMKKNSFVEKCTPNDVLESNFFSAFQTNPKLKIHLSWLSLASNQCLDDSKAVIDCQKFMPSKSQDFNNNTTVDIESTHIQILYNFLDSSNNQPDQHKLSFPKMICVWCSLDCLSLNSLLTHLEFYHLHCHHKYRATETVAHIDISVNNTWKAARQFQSGTKLLFHRQCQHKSNYKKVHTKNEEIKQRQYFHSKTLLPIHPNELSNDSEEEPMPEFFVERMFTRIDQPSNMAHKDEKTIMKLWNRHMMKHRYVGPHQIRLACEKFVENFGTEIVSQKLYNAFVMHLNKLFEENLVTAEFIWNAISKIKEIMAEQIVAATEIALTNDGEDLPQPNTSSSPNKEPKTLVEIKKELITASVLANSLNSKIKINKTIENMSAEKIATATNTNNTTKPNLLPKLELNLLNSFDENYRNKLSNKHNSPATFVRRNPVRKATLKTTKTANLMPFGLSPKVEPSPKPNTNISFNEKHKNKFVIKQESNPVTIRLNPVQKAALAYKQKSNKEEVLKNFRPQIIYNLRNTIKFKNKSKNMKPARRSARLVALCVNWRL